MCRGEPETAAAAYFFSSNAGHAGHNPETQPSMFLAQRTERHKRLTSIQVHARLYFMFRSTAARASLSSGSLFLYLDCVKLMKCCLCCDFRGSFSSGSPPFRCVVFRNRLDTVSPSHNNICNYQTVPIQVPLGGMSAIKSMGQMLMK